MSQDAQNGTAQIVPPKEPPRRVKVYELKDNDWHDRGTGFCIGLYVDVSLTARDECLRIALARVAWNGRVDRRLGGPTYSSTLRGKQ